MSILSKMFESFGRGVRVVLSLALITIGLVVVIAFGVFRVYVPPGYCLVRIAKAGAPMSGEEVVAEPGQKGIQRETWGPGRYFLNPILWETKLVPLVEIEAGRPDSWTWVHTLARLPMKRGAGGNIIAGEFPEVGILTRRSGPRDPSGSAVVSFDSGYRGIIREVLTPGVYRINPYEYDVQEVPAVVIPAGFVGVVTSQVGEQMDTVEVPDVLAPAPDEGEAAATVRVRPLARPGQRGTLPNVLTPGVYYLNPNVHRVRITEVGFNEFSQISQREDRDTIRFPSKSGFMIELGVTVVWGLHPRHAAEVINEFGATDAVLENVIKPQLRSICRNQGSQYEARDFIQGEKREEFQGVLTNALKSVCRRKNIELLLALISTIEVYGPDSSAVGQVDLKAEIQNSFIAIEKRITNEKLQETAKKKALLEEAKKRVDIARESIQADTRKRVQTLLAEGRRRAAEIEAKANLAVATIEQQIAALDAQKIELLGKAKADVEKLKNQAEADGRRMLVDALGSAAAYNLYTFAQNFDPESIQLIFAGPGTFWTDLKKIEELGASQMLRQSSPPAPAR